MLNPGRSERSQLPVQDIILQFSIIVAAVLAVQLAFEQSRAPAVIGLLLLGMLLGPGGLNVLPAEPVVRLFGAIGLLYIMFSAGSEIDLDIVRQRKSEAIGFGLVGFFLSFVPMIGVGLAAGLEPAGAVLVGAALSSHTLVSYPFLSQMGLVRRPSVIAATGGTLVTDTAALLVLAITVQHAGAGAAGLGWLTPMLLLGVIAVGALVTVPRLADRVLTSRVNNLPEKALFVLVVLVLLSLATEKIGAEGILGAFLAGICLNRGLNRRKELHEHVEFVGRMLFIPFFFVETGMRLELKIFIADLQPWLLAGALLGVTLGAKTLAASIVARRAGYSRDDQLVMAGLIYPQAAATLVVVVTGLELGLVDKATADAVIIVTFLTCMIGPLLTNFAARRLKRQR